MATLRTIHLPSDEAADHSFPPANGSGASLDQSVYEALKALDYLRRKKKGKITIERAKLLVEDRVEWDSIKKLLDEYSMSQICISLRRLQHDGVFISATVAARRFPEPPPVIDDPISEHVYHEEVEEQEEAESSNLIEGPPLVTPVEIPFGAQYRLLVHVQDCLERVCYNYGRKNMPEEDLLRQGWDCAEAVTLHSWINLDPNLQVMPMLDDRAEVPEGTLQAIVDIPRRTVARTRTTSAKLEELLRGAEDYIEILKDEAHLTAIQSLREDVHLAIEDLNQSECHLQDELKKSLSEIAEQRAKLDRKEQAIISRVKKDRERYQARAGLEIKSAVERSNEVQLANNISDRD